MFPFTTNVVSEKLSLCQQHFLLLFLKGLFLEQFYAHGKIEWKVQRLPICPLLPHTKNIPHHQDPEWYIPTSFPFPFR